MLKLLAVLALLSTGLVLTVSGVSARVVLNTVGDTAVLAAHGHVVQGNVLIECTAGQWVQFTLTFTQGGASGTGYGAGRCNGELKAFKVWVPARRGASFVPGAAAACATAINRDRGVIVDTREWCRAAPVTLLPATAHGFPHGD